MADEERRRKIAAMRAESEARLAESERRLAEHRRESAEKRAAKGKKDPKPWNDKLLSLGLVALGIAMIFGTYTLERFDGVDVGKAFMRGTATITSCTQKGPIGFDGYGFYDECSGSITWEDGSPDRLTQRPGFDSGDIGTTVTVGKVGTPDDFQITSEALPARPWLAWIGRIIAVLALVPIGLGAFGLTPRWGPRDKK